MRWWGLPNFCPACGHNPADQVFALTIIGIRQSLDALGAVRAAISDRDTAKSTTRLIVENGLQNTVNTFQRCAEAIFARLPSAPKARRNAFQNLTEGSQLWQAATGNSYSNHLSGEEFKRLNQAFQQRHLLAHTQGIIDEDYVKKSGDGRYRPGQRVVVRVENVRETLELVEKLVAGLQSDAAGI